MTDWKVVTTAADRTRTLFSGLEKDCRKYISEHFPRAHVEPGFNDPGKPDVKLVGPDGTEDTHHAEDGWASENKQEEAAPAAPAVVPGSDLK